MKQTLSTAARDVITEFENLEIAGKQIRCPYFNNKKTNVRAALGVLVGKGSPSDITNEARIIALRDHVDLSGLDEDALRAFLVEHHLGVDCSAFAYYILQAEPTEQKKDIRKMIQPLSKNILRKFIARWRTVENVNVKTLASDINSTIISLKDIQPGDLITLLGTGVDHDLDHVLIVESVEREENLLKNIWYVHSLQWKADGKYGHGIKRGEIQIVHPDRPLVEQHWIEAEKTGDDNETLWRAKTAQSLDIRRLLC